MPKHSKKLWALPVVAFLAIACGGGGNPVGGGPGGSPNDRTRQNVQETLSKGTLALMQSGFQTEGQAGMINGDAGTTGGGGVGVPMIGAYVRNMGMMIGAGGGVAMSRPSRDGGTTGGTSGGGTGDGDDWGEWDWTFYFDEYLGLWVQNNYTETSWETLLFEDREKTLPAGSFRSTYSDWSTFPVTGITTYEITAGPFKGANGRYETAYNEDYSGWMTYDNFWPGYGRDQGESRWSETEYTWKYSGEYDDGSWYRSDGRFNGDGSGSAVSSTSQGYKWTFRYNADGSGSGLIEGPDPGLPAKVTWTLTKYRIEYADGTVEEWDWSGYWYEGDPGDGTTTGSGDGSTRIRRR